MKTLPTDCSKSKLEMILQMAPGEDKQLDKKIEKIHNLGADVRLILFDTNEGKIFTFILSCSLFV